MQKKYIKIDPTRKLKSLEIPIKSLIELLNQYRYYTNLKIQYKISFRIERI